LSATALMVSPQIGQGFVSSSMKRSFPRQDTASTGIVEDSSFPGLGIETWGTRS
jgi:hypothetical protein